MNQNGSRQDSAAAEVTLNKMAFGSWMTQISKECEPARKLHHKRMYERKKESANVSQGKKTQPTTSATQNQQTETQIDDDGETQRQYEESQKKRSSVSDDDDD